MTIREMIAVLEAAERGEAIERQAVDCCCAPWILDKAPDWNFRCFNYRVKSKPLEGWINEYPDGPGSCFHQSPEEADKYAQPERIRRIHLREVEE